MLMSGKRYPEELKIEVVKQVDDRRHSQIPILELDLDFLTFPGNI